MLPSRARLKSIRPGGNFPLPRHSASTSSACRARIEAQKIGHAELLAANAELRRLDRDQPMTAVRSMESIIEDSTVVSRLMAVLVLIFAGIAMLIDITDRKKAEEELQASLERRTAQDEELRAQYEELSRSRDQIRESEEKFRALAEHAPVAIGVIQDNRYVYMNGHLLRALGCTREEIASMDYWVPVREDQQQKIRQDGEAWARGEAGPWMNELEYFTKSGERKWAVSTAAHIMYGGRHAGIVAMVGITERKKAEEELKRGQGLMRRAEIELRALLEAKVAIDTPKHEQLEAQLGELAHGQVLAAEDVALAGPALLERAPVRRLDGRDDVGKRVGHH